MVWFFQGPQKAIFCEDPEGDEAVAPVKFFSFFVCSRMVLYGDFFDSAAGLNEAKGEFDGEGHVVSVELHVLDGFAAKDLVAGFGVCELCVPEDV